MTLSRRKFLTGVAAGSAVLATGAVRAGALPQPPLDVSPADLARDEAFWREVGRHYERTEGIVNLEHGYWGKMARPVRDAYLDATRMVNRQNSWYGRKGFKLDALQARDQVAATLGGGPEEIVITRNATEAIQNLVLQYRGLEEGDAVLLADADYPEFKNLMHWLEEGRGVEVIEIELPTRADLSQVRDRYLQAFDAHPNLKLMLITHVSNQHGLVVPVAEVAAEARKRGIDVICDAAQSWGLLDYRIGDLGVDWAGFNLHKWIGSPLGVGALYMKRGSLGKVAPYPGETDPEDTDTATRVHSGTTNFASVLAIPAALEFHHAVGAANKEARLRYLRSLWTDEVEAIDQVEILGGADEAAWTGIGSFRLRGRTTIEDAQALQGRLEQDFGIFTVARKGLASGGCVRVTPQVFNTPDEIAQLVEALRRV